MRNLVILSLILLLIWVVLDNEMNPTVTEPTPAAVESAPAHRAKAGLGLVVLAGIGFVGVWLIMRRGRGEGEYAVIRPLSEPNEPAQTQIIGHRRRVRKATGITIDPARFTDAV